jgi:hypothetical protein
MDKSLQKNYFFALPFSHISFHILHIILLTLAFYVTYYAYFEYAKYAEYINPALIFFAYFVAYFAKFHIILYIYASICKIICTLHTPKSICRILQGSYLHIGNIYALPTLLMGVPGLGFAPGQPGPEATQ